MRKTYPNIFIEKEKKVKYKWNEEVNDTNNISYTWQFFSINSLNDK